MRREIQDSDDDEDEDDLGSPIGIRAGSKDTVTVTQAGDGSNPFLKGTGSTGASSSLLSGLIMIY